MKDTTCNGCGKGNIAPEFTTSLYMYKQDKVGIGDYCPECMSKKFGDDKHPVTFRTKEKQGY